MKLKPGLPFIGLRVFLLCILIENPLVSVSQDAQFQYSKSLVTVINISTSVIIACAKPCNPCHLDIK